MFFLLLLNTKSVVLPVTFAAQDTGVIDVNRRYSFPVTSKHKSYLKLCYDSANQDARARYWYK